MHSSDSAATGRSLAGVTRGACRALAAQASAMMRCMVIALAAVALVECSTGDEKGDVWPIFLAQTINNNGFGVR